MRGMVSGTILTVGRIVFIWSKILIRSPGIGNQVLVLVASILFPPSQKDYDPEYEDGENCKTSDDTASNGTGIVRAGTGRAIRI
jgi:hypothetical protein